MTNLTDRVYKFLRKQKKKKAWDFSDAPDERQAGKVVHKMGAVHHALQLGLLGNQPSLRDVEDPWPACASAPTCERGYHRSGLALDRPCVPFQPVLWLWW